MTPARVSTASGFPRWMHAAIGALGLAAGLWWVHAELASLLVVLGAIAYTSWLTGRATGICLAICAGGAQLAARDQQPPGDAVAVAALWLVVYLSLALATSAIETATRPRSP